MFQICNEFKAGTIIPINILQNEYKQRAFGFLFESSENVFERSRNKNNIESSCDWTRLNQNKLRMRISRNSLKSFEESRLSSPRGNRSDLSKGDNCG